MVKGARGRLLGVRLAPEWTGPYPVWVTDPDDEVPIDISPRELADDYGVPVEICAEIEEWDREFQAAYRPDDPAESGFQDEETMDRWVERGLAVARRLAAELGPRIPVEIRTARGAVLVRADPTTTDRPWRGYINQLAFAAWPAARLSDDAIEQVVESVLRQRVFSSPVEIYYDAAVAALESGQRLADLPGHEENAVRDALTRIVDRLDARRPWPVHPYYRQDADGWSALADAPVIGRVPLSQMQVRRTLNRTFHTVGSGPGEAKVLILRLRTGQIVALRSTEAFIAPGIDLLATADPATTIADFRDLTGLPVEPR